MPKKSGKRSTKKPKRKVAPTAAKKASGKMKKGAADAGPPVVAALSVQEALEKALAREARAASRLEAVSAEVAALRVALAAFAVPPADEAAPPAAAPAAATPARRRRPTPSATGIRTAPSAAPAADAQIAARPAVSAEDAPPEKPVVRRPARRRTPAS